MGFSDYGFIANLRDYDPPKLYNSETLRDLATAKKDCAEACDKNLSEVLAYYNETCKYATLLFEPKVQYCYLASSQDCDHGKSIEDGLNYHLYTKL